MTEKILLRFSRIFYGRPYETAQTDENMGKTRLQNLVRHKSGRYYARAFAGGKEVWKSLKTSHFSVAQARLAEFPEKPANASAMAIAKTRRRCLVSEWYRLSQPFLDSQKTRTIPT